MNLVEDYLKLLSMDLRPMAKEWNGPNLPVEGDNRPNWIRQCTTMLEHPKMKITCLRRLRDQAAMNPYYQHRIDRYIDEITDTYEPTDYAGTIPGNEFKTSGVGEDTPVTESMPSHIRRHAIAAATAGGVIAGAGGVAAVIKKVCKKRHGKDEEKINKCMERFGKKEYLEIHDDYSFIQENELLIEAMNFNRLQKVFTKHFSMAEKILKKHKVPVQKIKATGKRMGKVVEKGYRQGIPPDRIAAQIQRSVIKDIRGVIAPLEKDDSIGDKLLLAIAGLVVMMFIGSLMGVVMLGPAAIFGIEPLFLVACVVAPLTEEALKAYFIEMGIPWLGTSIFAGIEAIQYVTMLMIGGMGAMKAVLTRTLPVLLHFGTTAIQKKINDSPKEGEEDKKFFMAYAAGVGIHAMWNIMAIVIHVRGARG